MRPIKFRAWDKERAKMSPVCNISFGHDGSALTIIFQTAPQEKYYRGLVNGENGILMQFTGLKDKDGREIYEGDIVRIDHPHDMTGDFTNATGEVFWWDEEGGWYHGNDSGRPPKRMWNYVEVIGNIYENPELIRGDDA